MPCSIAPSFRSLHVTPAYSASVLDWGPPLSVITCYTWHHPTGRGGFPAFQSRAVGVQSQSVLGAGAKQAAHPVTHRHPCTGTNLPVVERLQSSQDGPAHRPAAPDHGPHLPPLHAPPARGQWSQTPHRSHGRYRPSHASMQALTTQLYTYMTQLVKYGFLRCKTCLTGSKVTGN